MGTENRDYEEVTENRALRALRPTIRPGRTHDLTAARAHGVIHACLARQLLVLADRAYQGAGPTVGLP